MSLPSPGADGSARGRTLATVGRFLISGGINTLATLALYWLLLRVMHAQAAYAIAFAAGLGLGYLLNSGFVFRARRRRRHLVGYPLAYACTYGAGAVVLHVATTRWQLDPRIAPLLSMAVSVPLSFVLLRLLLRERPV